MSTKECKSCKQPIAEAATKCHHCGTSQGFDITANKVSLYVGTVIAVISLATMGYESAKKIFKEEKAELIAYVPGVDYEQFNLVISNTGNKPGVIYDLTIKYPPAIECSGGDQWTMHRIDMSNHVVEPNKTITVSQEIKGLYKAFSGFDPHVLSDPNLSKQLEDFKVCSADLTYLDFDGTHKTLKVKFHCGPQGECVENSNNPVN